MSAYRTAPIVIPPVATIHAWSEAKVREYLRTAYEVVDGG